MCLMVHRWYFFVNESAGWSLGQIFGRPAVGTHQFLNIDRAFEGSEHSRMEEGERLGVNGVCWSGRSFIQL